MAAAHTLALACSQALTGLVVGGATIFVGVGVTALTGVQSGLLTLTKGVHVGVVPLLVFAAKFLAVVVSHCHLA